MAKHEEVFEAIYSKKYWGGINSPLSGTGSTPAAAAPYRNFVKEVIHLNKIQKVFDIGHGDWKIWSDYQFEGVDYCGIDVSPSISDELRKKSKKDNLHFILGNAVTDELPSAELCLSKDVLQHLPINDIQTILAKLNSFERVIICNDYYKFNPRDLWQGFRRFLSLGERFRGIKSGEKFLYLKLKRTNSEIQIGEYRCINLTKKPFKSYLKNFQIETIDFVGKDSHRPHVVKRIYSLERKATGR